MCHKDSVDSGKQGAMGHALILLDTSKGCVLPSGLGFMYEGTVGKAYNNLLAM